MAERVPLDRASLYDVIEAYRLPFYLGAAVEAVGYAGRYSSSVRMDCTRALAYLTRLGRTTSPRLQPMPAKASVVAHFPPAAVADALVAGWESREPRREAVRLMLSACVPDHAAARELQQAAEVLGGVVAVATEGRGIVMAGGVVR